MRPEHLLNRRYIQAKVGQVYVEEEWVVEARAPSEPGDLGDLHK
jgi:hypothetical protein